MLGGSAGGSAFALDRIADGALEQTGIESRLDQVIGSARLHGFQVNFALSLPGQQNNRRLATLLYSQAQQLDAVLGAEPIIQQANVMLVADHRLQARREIVDPLQMKVPALDFSKEASREDVVILVVLNQEHLEPITGQRGLHYFFTGSSTVSNQ